MAAQMSKQPALDVGTTKFTAPVKKIFDSQGTYDFQSSLAISRLNFFLRKYVQMVKKQKICHDPSNVPAVNSFVQLLSSLSALIDQTPPLAGPRRYGNLACRDWHSKVDSSLSKLLEDLLPQNDQRCIVELKYYLGNSFGSSTRLDYGTGHELSFLAVIGALDMLGFWTENITGQDILLIFDTYYKLVRRLILTYTLEPAGSHGVWGLDDHFHLAYILGSSQWSNDPKTPISPRDITNVDLVQGYADTNLYCQAINFIYKVKSGPFSEHSSMLYDIATTVHTWSKVQSGLLKMYAVEVLNKFPVVQHFWFGTGFYPWIDIKSGKELPVYENSTEIEREEELRTTQGPTISLANAPPITSATYHLPPGSGHTGSRLPVVNAIPSKSSMRPTMGPPTSRLFSNRSNTASPTLYQSPKGDETAH